MVGTAAKAVPPVRMRHALSGATYELLNDGTVLVTAANGQQGIFDQMARPCAGELTEADALLTYWIAGPHPAKFLDVTNAHVDVPEFSKRHLSRMPERETS